MLHRPAPVRRRRALAHACVACRKPWALRAMRNPDGVYLLICRFCSYRQVSGARAVLPSRPRDHEVLFAPVEHELVEHLAGYVEQGLAAGESCLVIATPEQRAAVRERVGDEVLTAAAREGAFVELDAADTLRLFLLDGVPDVALFEGTVGQFVRDQAVRGPVRVYGGMSSLLWSQRYGRTAVAVEELWNQLRASVSFSLLCAYPGHGLEGRVRADLCRVHSSMVA